MGATFGQKDASNTFPYSEQTLPSALVCQRRSVGDTDLAYTAVNDVDLVDRFVGVYNDLARAEDVANDTHTQIAKEVVRRVLKQRHLLQTCAAHTVHAG